MEKEENKSIPVSLPDQEERRQKISLGGGDRLEFKGVLGQASL